MTPNTLVRHQTIRALNDRLRCHFIGGQVMITTGIQALGPASRVGCVQAVRAFEDFDEDNDPHGEHDFGALEVFGRRVLWKIDYYDATLEAGSPDPADPSVTTRVLIVMLADEY